MKGLEFSSLGVKVERGTEVGRALIARLEDFLGHRSSRALAQVASNAPDETNDEVLERRGVRVLRKITEYGFWITEA